jgi:hypothetical protein
VYVARNAFVIRTFGIELETDAIRARIFDVITLYRGFRRALFPAAFVVHLWLPLLVLCVIFL